MYKDHKNIAYIVLYCNMASEIMTQRPTELGPLVTIIN